MKKTIVSMAFAALSLVAFSGMAQNTANNADNTTKKECVKGDKKCDKDCKDMKKGDKSRKDMKGDRKGQKDGKQFKGKKQNPFEGINLTEAQKTKLQDLNNKQKEARMAKMQAKKENKQRNDSLMMAERKAEKKAYLEEVKAIIGPENYVVFLENVYMTGGQPRGDKAAFGPGQGQKGKMMRDGKGSKGGNRDQKQASAKGMKKNADKASKS